MAYSCDTWRCANSAATCAASSLSSTQPGGKSSTKQPALVTSSKSIGSPIAILTDPRIAFRGSPNAPGVNVLGGGKRRCVIIATGKKWVVLSAALADINLNISTDLGSKAAGVYTPSASGRSLPPEGATQMHLPPPLKRRSMAVIVFALWRIFLDFSSGGLSMWRLL